MSKVVIAPPASALTEPPAETKSGRDVATRGQRDVAELEDFAVEPTGGEIADVDVGSGHRRDVGCAVDEAADD